MIKLFINKLKLQLKNYAPYKKMLAHIQETALPINLRGVNGGFFSILNAAVYSTIKQFMCIVVPTEAEAEEIQHDLSAILNGDVFLFPAWNTAAYNPVSAPAEIFAQRLKVLVRLREPNPLIVVMPLKALLSTVPPVNFIMENCITLNRGQQIDRTDFIYHLENLGFSRVPHVSVKTEYAVRGEVIDVFIPGYDEALRIMLNFDRIDALRFFDPFSQRSLQVVDRAVIYPLREVVINQRTKTNYARNMEKAGYKAAESQDLLERIILNPELTGLEYLIPLFYSQTATPLDYFSVQPLLILKDSDALENGAKAIETEYRELCSRARRQKRVTVEPQYLLNDLKQLLAGRNNFVDFSTRFQEDAKVTTITMASDPPRSFFGNINYLKQELANLRAAGYEIYILADYEAQAERLAHILQDSKTTILPLALSKGFCLPDLKIIVIHEQEIFKRKKYTAVNLRKYKTAALDSFIELEQGDCVVHIQHGIGIYRGIERIKAAGFERDYIKVEYADKVFIFIPTEQVDLIQRYITTGGRHPRLDKIGGTAWLNRKRKVKDSVDDLAGKLLNLYSLRKKIQGISFSKDSEWQEEFEAGFPFEETPDQLQCIAEVKRDMESPYPMERLVCGDVGYGKTEIALRASFKAVMSGKQVAIIAPTTILVEQHYETFSERFRNFPVSIKMLSRFVPKQVQRDTIALLNQGEADLVIGTHRLLQKDVQFKNLGLLVIDEEQRFGVRDKEKIKELKSHIDCLILTATPIPRTLYMSLTKIKDMSLLNTPPLNRLPIETMVTEFKEEIIKDAIYREIKRQGQVFFLHNRVQGIEKIYEFVSRLVPDLKIAVSHGRMQAQELEDIMHDFIHKRYDILLSTTIIENGIDIPNVNTIIIDRADMMGIAQLYQLRGRVGRSDVPAYAYLLYPEKRALSPLALRRLKIISNYTELGSGFKIALKDLELRGAGNLLGREQHGDILSVGFEMYMKLLDEAIALQDKKDVPEKAPEPLLELEYSGYIPDSYIGDMLEKMEVYKKIASITTEDDLTRIYQELEDRYGPLPAELHSILSLAELRILASKLFITSIKEKKGIIRIEFAKLSLISVERVMRLLKESGGMVYLDSRKPQCIFIRVGNIGLKEKSLFIKEKLSLLL